MSGFERITEFVPAYDRKAEGYGIHGVELRMVLKGELGAAQFVLYTNWMLPETLGAKVDDDGLGTAYHRYVQGNEVQGWPKSLQAPMPADLGYHSPVPIYDDQEVTGSECEYLDGKPCYYDGSGLNAWRPFEALLREGHDGVWRVLEDYYASVFAEVAAS